MSNIGSTNTDSLQRAIEMRTGGRAIRSTDPVIDINQQTKVPPPPSNLLYNTFGKLNPEDAKRRKQLLDELNKTKEVLAPTEDKPQKSYDFDNPELFTKDLKTNVNDLTDGISQGKLTRERINKRDLIFTVDAEGKRGNIPIAEIERDGKLKRINYSEPSKVKLFGMNMPLPGTDEPVTAEQLKNLNTGKTKVNPSDRWAQSPLGIDPAINTIRNWFRDEDKQRVLQDANYLPPANVTDGYSNFNPYDLGQSISGALTGGILTGGAGGGALATGLGSAVPTMINNFGEADKGQRSYTSAAGVSAMDAGAGMLGGRLIPKIGQAVKEGGKSAGRVIGEVAGGDFLLGAGRNIIDQASQPENNKSSVMDYLNSEALISGGIQSGLGLGINSLAGGGARIVTNKLNNALQNRYLENTPTNKLVADIVKPEYNPITKQSKPNPQGEAKVVEILDKAQAAQNEARTMQNGRVVTVANPLKNNEPTVVIDTTPTQTGGGTLDDVAKELVDKKAKLPQTTSKAKALEVGQLLVPGLDIKNKKEVDIATFAINNPEPFVKNIGNSYQTSNPDAPTPTITDLTKEVKDVYNGRYIPTETDRANINSALGDIGKVADGSTEPTDIYAAKKGISIYTTVLREEKATRLLNAVENQEAADRIVTKAYLEVMGGNNTIEATSKAVDKYYNIDPVILDTKISEAIDKKIIENNPALEPFILQSTTPKLPDEIQVQSSNLNIPSETGVAIVGYNAPILNDVVGAIKLDDFDGAVNILVTQGELNPAQALKVAQDVNTAIKDVQPSETPIEIDGAMITDWNVLKTIKPIENEAKPVVYTYVPNEISANANIAGAKLGGNNTELSRDMFIAWHPSTDTKVKKVIVETIKAETGLTGEEIRSVANKIHAEFKKTGVINADPYLKPPPELVIDGLGKPVNILTDEAKAKKQAANNTSQVISEQIAAIPPTTTPIAKAVKSKEIVTTNYIQPFQTDPQIKTPAGATVSAITDNDNLNVVVNYNPENATKAEQLVVGGFIEDQLGLTPSEVAKIREIIAEDISSQHSKDLIENKSDSPSYTLSDNGKSQVDMIMVKAQKRIFNTPRGKAQKKINEQPEGDLSLQRANSIAAIEQGENIAHHVKQAAIPLMMIPTIDEEDVDNYDNTYWAGLSAGTMFLLLGSKNIRQRIIPLRDKIVDNLTTGTIGQKFRATPKYNEDEALEIIAKSTHIRDFKKNTLQTIDNDPELKDLPLETKAQIVETTAQEEMARIVKVAPELYIKPKGTLPNRAKDFPSYNNIFNAMVDAEQQTASEVKPILKSLDNFIEQTPKPLREHIINGNIQAFRDGVDLKNNPNTTPEMLAVHNQSIFDNYIATPEFPMQSLIDTWNEWRDINDALTMAQIGTIASGLLENVPVSSFVTETPLTSRITFLNLLEIEPEVRAKLEAFDKDLLDIEFKLDDYRLALAEGTLDDQTANTLSTDLKTQRTVITDGSEYTTLNDVRKIIDDAKKFYADSRDNSYVDIRATERQKDSGSKQSVAISSQILNPDGSIERLPTYQQPVKYFKRFPDNDKRQKAITQYLTAKGAKFNKATGKWTLEEDGKTYVMSIARFDLAKDREAAQNKQSDVLNVLQHIVATSQRLAETPNSIQARQKLEELAIELDGWKMVAEDLQSTDSDAAQAMLNTINKGETAINELKQSSNPDNVVNIITNLFGRIAGSGNTNKSFNIVKHTNADGWATNYSGKPFTADDHLTALSEKATNIIGQAENTAAIIATQRELGMLRSLGLADTPVGNSLSSFKDEIMANRSPSFWQSDIANALTQGVGILYIGFKTTTAIKNLISNVNMMGMNKQTTTGSIKPFDTIWDGIVRPWVGTNRSTVWNALTQGMSERSVNNKMNLFNQANDLFYNYADSQAKYYNPDLIWSEQTLRTNLTDRFLDAGTFSETIFSNIASNKTSNPILKTGAKILDKSHLMNRAVDVFARVGYTDRLVSEYILKNPPPYSDAKELAKYADKLFREVNLEVMNAYGKFSPLYKTSTERRIASVGGGIFKPFMLFSAPATVSLMNWHRNISTSLKKADTFIAKKLFRVSGILAFATFLGGYNRIPAIKDLFAFIDTISTLPENEQELLAEKFDPTLYESVENQTRSWLQETYNLDQKQIDKMFSSIQYGALSGITNKNFSQDEGILQFFDPVMLQFVEKMGKNVKNEGLTQGLFKSFNAGIIKDINSAYNNLSVGNRQYKDVNLYAEDDYGSMDALLDFTFGQPLEGNITREGMFSGKVPLSTPVLREQWAKTFLSNSSVRFLNTQGERLVSTPEFEAAAPMVQTGVMARLQDADIDFGMKNGFETIDKLFKDPAKKELLEEMLRLDGVTEENRVDAMVRMKQAMTMSIGNMYGGEASIRGMEDFLKTDVGRVIADKYYLKNTYNNAAYKPSQLVNNVFGTNYQVNENGRNDPQFVRDYGKIGVVNTLLKRAFDKQAQYSPGDPYYNKVMDLCKEILKGNQ